MGQPKGHRVVCSIWGFQYQTAGGLKCRFYTSENAYYTDLTAPFFNDPDHGVFITIPYGKLDFSFGRTFFVQKLTAVGVFYDYNRG